MRGQQINQASTIGLTVLSLIALLDVVLLGYARPLLFGFPLQPAQDEGAGAHIFQLAIVLLAPVGLVFLATADWTQPLRAARRLAVPAVVVVLSFAALYYLENYFYPPHYR